MSTAPFITPSAVEHEQPLTQAEKQSLKDDILKLPSHQLGPLVEILSKGLPKRERGASEEEVELDMDILSTATLREARTYVTATLAAQKRGSAARSAQATPAAAAVVPAAVAAAAPSISSSSPARRRVIIDMDGGCDDAIAILLALRDPNVEVVAFTSVFGNVPMDQATENIYTILRVFDRLDIPFFAGCSGPLVQDAGVIDTWPGHGANGLGDASFLEGGSGSGSMHPHDHLAYQAKVRAALKPGHAALALVDYASRFPGQIDLIALGPLTNLALASRLDPAFPSRIKSLTMMGGSVFGKGNASLAAEFNFFVDADGAAVVLSAFAQAAKCEVLVVPWEATQSAGLSWAEFDELTAGHEEHIFGDIESRHTLEASFLKKTHAKYELVCRDLTDLPPVHAADAAAAAVPAASASAAGGKIITADQADALNEIPSLPELQAAAAAAAAASSAAASSSSALPVIPAAESDSSDRKYVCCDAYAVACLLHPDLIRSAVSHYAEVVTQGSAETRGMLAVDWYDRRTKAKPNHRKIKIVTKIHQPAFMQLMRETFQPNAAATRAAAKQ